jgi:uncharacterized protein (DUF3084 family)
MKWIAIVSIAAALGLAYFAWQTHGALEETRVEVRSVRAQLTQAQADTRKARTEAEAAAKEASHARIAAEQAGAEAKSARAFLDAERGMNLKLREDIALLQQRIAMGSRAPAASPAALPMPMLVRPQQPMVIRAVPAPAPQGVAVPAR